MTIRETSDTPGRLRTIRETSDTARETYDNKGDFGHGQGDLGQ